jgi:hypothetical protein
LPHDVAWNLGTQGAQHDQRLASQNVSFIVGAGKRNEDGWVKFGAQREVHLSVKFYVANTRSKSDFDRFEH